MSTIKGEFEIVDGHIIFKKIVPDEDAGNPLTESDGMGMIYSFNNRHVNHKHPNEIKDDPDRVLLSYFEHGLCKWGVAGTMVNMPDFRWDGIGAAGVWYPDDVLRAQADTDGLKAGTSERLEKMKEWAGQACTEYTSWCNGEVYGIIIEVYKAKYEANADEGFLYDDEGDYRFIDPIFEESCFQFYGRNYAEEELKGFVKTAKEAIAGEK